jgi:hypothetical protein
MPVAALAGMMGGMNAHQNRLIAGRRIGQMMRRIEATLEGISDHQELLAGLRALVRIVRSDPA